MIDNPFVSPKAIFLFVLAFIIYINLKIALFKKFVAYGKYLMKAGKKPVQKKKIISEYEIQANFESSTFKRVSQIEYSSEMLKKMYSISGKSLETDNPLPPKKDCVFLKKIEIDDSEEIPKYQIKIKM